MKQKIYCHLRTRRGLYQVVGVNDKYLFLKTNREEYKTAISNFKCFAGGSWSRGINNQKLFILILSKLSPERQADQLLIHTELNYIPPEWWPRPIEVYTKSIRRKALRQLKLTLINAR